MYIKLGILYMTSKVHKNYDPPSNEECFCLTLNADKRVAKKLRTFVIFKKSKRIFFNMELLSQQGILCYLCDGVGTMKYDEKSPQFIDADWIVDEKIDGEDFWKQIKRIRDELLANKTIGWDE